jgi:hypothetical protein
MDPDPRPACKLSASPFIPGSFFRNLTCEQFADGYEYYIAYMKTKDDDYLFRMLGVLYRFKPYGTEYAKHMELKIKRMEDSWIKNMGLHYFSSNLQFIATHPRYKILFNSNGSGASSAIDFGMSSTIYEIMDEYKIGLNETRNYLFPEYLDILLRQRIKYIRQLQSMGKKDIEIAKETGITLEELSKI